MWYKCGSRLVEAGRLPPEAALRPRSASPADTPSVTPPVPARRVHRLEADSTADPAGTQGAAGPGANCIGARAPGRARAAPPGTRAARAAPRVPKHTRASTAVRSRTHNELRGRGAARARDVPVRLRAAERTNVRACHPRSGRMKTNGSGESLESRRQSPRRVVATRPNTMMQPKLGHKGSQVTEQVTHSRSTKYRTREQRHRAFIGHAPTRAPGVYRKQRTGPSPGVSVRWPLRAPGTGPYARAPRPSA